jgi:hypothetical protein
MSFPESVIPLLKNIGLTGQLLCLIRISCHAYCLCDKKTTLVSAINYYIGPSQVGGKSMKDFCSFVHTFDPLLLWNQWLELNDFEGFPISNQWTLNYYFSNRCLHTETYLNWTSVGPACMIRTDILFIHTETYLNWTSVGPACMIRHTLKSI